MSNFAARLVVAVTLLTASAVAVAAQERLQRVEAFKDWAVFADTAAADKLCYAATVPVQSRADREGIRRGDVYMLVSSYPNQDVRDEISVKLGFPTDPQKPPRLEIGSARFTMFSDGEEAWLETPEDDRKAVAAMRAGSKAVVTAVSARGTTTTDEFSLLGFTASLNKVGELCR